MDITLRRVGAVVKQLLWRVMHGLTLPSPVTVGNLDRHRQFGYVADSALQPHLVDACPLKQMGAFLCGRLMAPSQQKGCGLECRTVPQILTVK